MKINPVGNQKLQKDSQKQHQWLDVTPPPHPCCFPTKHQKTLTDADNHERHTASGLHLNSFVEGTDCNRQH